ncbi:PQQ-dependent sugar dehydrogenase [Glycomyces luteolus]|uniref:PQQ-dependent sugar dehydrogenase n=1 Tax=Glycomyces luteolus TaxID=2670330 RepID=A0A9X3T4H3_9ACTN|nr:PQQ-dependent sugar dehydrogenase [Glycomyces luteolus]MDA1361090.1 PQQ-dependent sugar dehydrogenase [Glycomyces luteolus]
MVSRRRALGLTGAVIAGATAAACTADDAAGPTANGRPSRFGDPEVIATGLDAPWSIAFHDGTPLISERDTARILELDGDGNAREVAVVDGVLGSGEGGLLGMAINDGYLYAYYTGDGDNRIDRFELSGEAGTLALGEAQRVLVGIPAARFHNGGRIKFGPDGMLYATVGDTGNASSAQDLESLSGKILRMTPEGGVPDGNPFPGSLVYTWGHRNPQGIAWTDDGAMYAAEFGQDTWDELNLIEAGANYGWPEVEGIGDGDEYTNPIAQWGTEEASPSGIAIAGGTVFIACLRGQRLIEVPLDDPESQTDHYVGEFGRLRDAAVAPDGSLWVLTNNTDGRGDPGPDDDRVLRIALD